MEPAPAGGRDGRERFTASERLEILRAFGGHCMSTSLLAPGMQHFDLPGAGFIGFTTCGGATLALSDPVAAPGHRATLLREFVARHPRASFVQISEAVAGILGDLGYFTTRFGMETLLDLQSWTLRGRGKQALRTAVNQARKTGISISEGCTGAERAALSREWLATRRSSRAEIGFLVRPLDMQPVPDARVFCARDGARPIGFVCFDPIFRDGNIVGYAPNVSRASAAFRQGIFFAITVRAMARFREEGACFVNLGLSPLAVQAGRRDGESAAFRKVLQIIYRHGNRLYNFEGVRFAKSRFRGREQPVFMAHRSRLPLLHGLALLRLTRLI